MLLMDFYVKTDCEDVDGTPGVNTSLFFWRLDWVFHFHRINSHVTKRWELYSQRGDLWVMFRPDSEQD